MANLQSQYVDAVIDTGVNPYPYYHMYDSSGNFMEDVMMEEGAVYIQQGSDFSSQDVEALAEGQTRIDTNAVSGDDYDLYTALTNANWTGAISGDLFTKNLFAKLVDFYVNNGFTEYTDNNWAVRKYNNGSFTATRKFSASNVTIGTAVGSLYQNSANLTLTMPSSITTLENVNITPVHGSYGVIPAVYGATTSTISYRLMSTASRTSTTYTLYFSISGKM